MKRLAIALLLSTTTTAVLAAPPRKPSPPTFDQLSPQVLELIGPTRLARDLPSPDEPLDVLRRYLQLAPYDRLSPTAYIALMRDSVERWPSSRFAHEGLANALRAAEGGVHGAEHSAATRKAAAAELLTAAELALAQGQLRYQRQLGQLLADVGDEQGIDHFFETAVEAAGDSGDLYETCLAYAEALARVRHRRADTQFACAIKARPNGIFEPYERYSAYLLAEKRFQEVLELLSADVVDRAESSRGLFFDMRCRALAGLGHDPSREQDCQRAKDAAPNRGRSTQGAAAPDATSTTSARFLSRLRPIRTSSFGQLPLSTARRSTASGSRMKGAGPWPLET